MPIGAAPGAASRRWMKRIGSFGTRACFRSPIRPAPPNCSGDVFMDSGGSFIHTVDPMQGQLQVLAFDTPADLRHVQTLTVPGLKRALISNGGSHVYAATHSSLLVFERDGETGALTQVGGTEPGLWNLESIAIGSDDRYLFAFDDNGRRIQPVPTGRRSFQSAA